MRTFRAVSCMLSTTAAIWAISPAAAQDAPPSDRSAGAADQEADIVVTAQKRTERLQDVPQSVSVLTADSLSKLAATQLRDFADTVPGLTYSSQGAGYTQLSLRGVTAGVDLTPTVALYVDEVPYGSTSSFALGSQLALDVGLFDLDRIEVLRGPQGTIYGAASLGGLVKYVTKQPKLDVIGVDAQAGISDTRFGSISYNGAVAVNVPLVTDKVAIRASGFYSKDGGYYDNVALGEKDVNSARTYGGRLDVLLQPTENLSVRINGFLQNLSREGISSGQDRAQYNGQDVGVLEQVRLTPEPFDQKFRLVSGTLSYNFGPVELNSITAYQTSRASVVADFSAAYGPLFDSILPGVITPTSVSYPKVQSTKKFTQEVRLSSTQGGHLEWTVGGFYVKENSKDVQSFTVKDGVGQVVPDIFSAQAPSSLEELAGFANLTYHITDKFDVSGGLRYSHTQQNYSLTRAGVFGSGSESTGSKENVTTYLANARYRFSNRTMIYARFATGYRPGGPNNRPVDPATGLPAGPEAFRSDSLKSYELGFRGETSDRTFGYDLSLYHIDWQDIQLTVCGNVCFQANGVGGARINGAEMTLTARPTRGFVVTGAFAYQDAKLKGDEPALGASKGDRLPKVPEFTAALNADYELVDSPSRPSVGATLRSISERVERIGTPLIVPSYVSVDLRTGLTVGPVALQAYVRNLFDVRPKLSFDAITGASTVLQPRTIGLTARTSF